MAFVLAVPVGAARGNDAEIANAIKEMLVPDVAMIAGRRLDVRALRRFYEPRENLPFWSGASGRRLAGPLVETLQKAGEHGLEPGDYHIDALQALPAADGIMDRANRDLLLSDAFLRYAADMRMGRIRIDQIENDWLIKPTPFDAAAALAAIGSPDDMRQALAGLPPASADYQHLVEALKKYSALARAGVWPTVSSGPTLKPGMSDLRVLEVRQRLIAEGMLAADQADNALFDKPLEAALRKWQGRYGMDVDGWVGPRTITVMNVSLLSRVEQIRVNLERQRSLPRHWPARAIYVNSASAELTMIENGQLVHAARVIVGRSPTPTPVLAARFSSMVLNPSWYVPRSIATKEFLPILQRDPLYLAKNNMVIMGREEDPSGTTIDWRVYNRHYLPFNFQQLPGPKTALGNVVFDMANPMDVYLHDTPDRHLFARGERYFSHGCIRVENPRALALYLLRGNTQWTEERYDDAVATDDTERVALAQPVPIFLLYATVISAKGGGIEFRADIYNRDQRLQLALETRRSQPTLFAVNYDDLMIMPAKQKPAKAVSVGTLPGAAAPKRATMAP